jgi:hypothetical protein
MKGKHTQQHETAAQPGLQPAQSQRKQRAGTRIAVFMGWCMAGWAAASKRPLRCRAPPPLGPSLPSPSSGVACLQYERVSHVVGREVQGQEEQPRQQAALGQQQRAGGQRHRVRGHKRQQRAGGGRHGGLRRGRGVEQGSSRGVGARSEERQQREEAGLSGAVACAALTVYVRGRAMARKVTQVKQPWKAMSFTEETSTPGVGWGVGWGQHAAMTGHA